MNVNAEDWDKIEWLDESLSPTTQEQEQKSFEEGVQREGVSAVKLFDNNSDCYADTWEDCGSDLHNGKHLLKEGAVIPAITKEKFVEIWEQYDHSPVQNLGIILEKPEDKDLIISALNFYWNEAHMELSKKGGGDIEIDNYKKQLANSKRVMDYLDNQPAIQKEISSELLDRVVWVEVPQEERTAKTMYVDSRDLYLNQTTLYHLLTKDKK